MTQTTEPTNWAAGIEGCLLVGLGTLLLRKGWEGQLPLYIHPRYVPLVLITGVLVLLIGAARLLEIGKAGGPGLRAGAYGLLLAPLLLGLLIPARPAGAALIDPQQLNSAGGRGYRSTNLLASDDSRAWTLYDWMFARYTLAPEQLAGRPVDVVGFVYRAPGQPADEFYVTRYVVACCIADRSGTSLVVRSPQASGLAADRWVRVTGSITLRPAQPPELLVADALVQPVPQPAEPYLYP
ncbi:MAG: hypothetical protein OHK0022_61250 [Roseiflexaceae bacterium]